MDYFACDAVTVGGHTFVTETAMRFVSASGCLQVCSKKGRRHGKHVL